MKKIISVFLMVCALGSLCACGASNTNSDESSLPAPSTIESETESESSDQSSLSSIIEDVSSYQSYTVDDNGTIIDTKTGSAIQDKKFSVDEKGNIVLAGNGQIAVTSDVVQKNKKLLNTIQENSQPKKETIPNQNSSIPSKNSSVTTNSTPKSSNTSSEEVGRYSSEPELHVKYPVMGDRAWTFYSTNPSNRTNWYIPENTVLTVYTINIQKNLSTEITCDYYALLDGYPYQIYDTNTIKTVNGVDYVWQMRSNYTGGCFPEYDGSVTLMLRCYDSFGNFLNDELAFTRVGADTMILKSNDGTALNLYPGDTFTR